MLTTPHYEPQEDDFLSLIHIGALHRTRRGEGGGLIPSRGKSGKSLLFNFHQSSLIPIMPRWYRDTSLCLLRWLNTVLEVFDYMSFAKSGQEKGCCSQAETWQVKSVLIKDFD